MLPNLSRHGGEISQMGYICPPVGGKFTDYNKHIYGLSIYQFLCSSYIMPNTD